ncbi:MAG: hypothetical protein ACI8ZN_000017 [Bacteroidia bacterium]|jgi:hypothetical protein
MKKVYFILAILSFSIGSAVAQEPIEPKPTITLTPDGVPKIHLTETEFDFKTIATGSQVEHVFTFVNEGSAPLVISEVKTPCSCTAPSFSKDAIAPGESGEIKLQYSAGTHSGQFVKTVTVHYNGDQSPDFITIKGNIAKPTNSETK